MLILKLKKNNVDDMYIIFSVGVSNQKKQKEYINKPKKRQIKE